LPTFPCPCFLLPQVFRCLRNRIIELAGASPGQRLLFADVRAALPGQEVNGLQR
jgi:hypothetical protein